MRPVGSAEALAARRLVAAKMYAKGWTPAKVSQTLEVAYAAAWNWHAAWKRDGVAGLAPIERPARARKLSRRQLNQLQAAILRGAKKAGFPDDTWTCPRVQQWIQKKFDVTYHVDHLPKLLRALDLTPQQPRRRAIERNDAEVESFRKRVWPRIKKGRTQASEAGIHRRVRVSYAAAP